MHVRLAFCLLIGLICPALTVAQDKDSIFDVPALLTAGPLNARTLKGPYEKEGVMVEEVMFHSGDGRRQERRYFRHRRVPQGWQKPARVRVEPGRPVPGHGLFPDLRCQARLRRALHRLPHRRALGYRSTGGYTINNTLATADDPKQAPIYHGAVALLRAVTYLESRPEVDKDRIGMCGSSWGGYYTTLMVGIDPRLKVGSAMFGCGFLDNGNNWWGPVGGKELSQTRIREAVDGHLRRRPTIEENQNADRLVHGHRRHVLLDAGDDGELRRRGGAETPDGVPELRPRAARRGRRRGVRIPGRVFAASRRCWRCRR